MSKPIKKIAKTTFVKSFTGKIVQRQNVRFIRGKYYIPNEECFFIGGQWYRINSDKIIFDHAHDRWRLISEGIYVHGVVNIDFDDKEGPFILGYFSPDVIDNIEIAIGKYNFNVVPGLSENLLRMANFEESPSGYFYLPNYAKKESLSKSYEAYPIIESRGSYYPHIEYLYGAADHISNFTDSFNRFFRPPAIISEVPEGLPYSYGVEFETCMGAIPERKLFMNGLIPCRDGSIHGFEYATIPLRGALGMQALHRHCSMLNKHCRISHKDSLHVHLGRYPRNKKYIMALYKLCTLLQDEIYTMFPVRYRNTGEFKNRNYCSPLNYLASSTESPYNFPSLFSALGGDPMNAEITNTNHPHDTSGVHKWNINHRYKIINFVPLIWGLRGTVEFRVHTPTMDYTKVSYWVFLCSSILKYAEKHAEELLGRLNNAQKTLTLNKVIKDVYTKETASKMGKYIRLRKKWYENNYDSCGELEVGIEDPTTRTLIFRTISEEKINTMKQMLSLKPLIQIKDE